MTDAAIVLQKLTTLRDHLARVRRRRPASAEMLRADVDVQDALALSLLVAIQERRCQFMVRDGLSDRPAA